MAVNKRSLANLRPFGKGHQPVVRGGGPRKGLAEIRWAAEQIPAEKMVAHIRSFYPDVQDRLTNERAVALAMWKAAIEGNVQAARELWERMYGKVKQEIEGTLGDNAAELLQRFADGLERADTDTTPVSP